MVLVIALVGFWYGLLGHETNAQDFLRASLGQGLSITAWTPGVRCKNTVPTLLVITVNPNHFRFSTYNFRDERLSTPLTIAGWSQRTKATIVFNAGLFREDYSYMGLLFKEGRPIGPTLHPTWKGLFVAEPYDATLNKARVLDLAREAYPTTPPAYRHAAQSLMLVDDQGQPRVRKSGKRAHETVVGEDRTGKILLIKTTASVALWDLAVCLRAGIHNLRHAMVMDGGASSDLLLAEEVLARLPPTNPFTPWLSIIDGTGRGHIPLPTVIGITPRPR